MTDRTLARLAFWTLFAAAVVMLLAGCTRTVLRDAEPRIITKEVATPIATGCVPLELGAPPEYPDSEAALAAATPDRRYLLLWAGRALRVARLNDLEAVIAGCPKERK